jgi:hypothetical protein
MRKTARHRAPVIAAGAVALAALLVIAIPALAAAPKKNGWQVHQPRQEVERDRQLLRRGRNENVRERDADLHREVQEDRSLAPGPAALTRAAHSS